MRIAFLVPCLAIALLTCRFDAAVAGCNEEKVGDIAIPAGRSCWIYKGDALKGEVQPLPVRRLRIS